MSWAPTWWSTAWAKCPRIPTTPRFGRLVEALTALGAYGQRAGARLAALTGQESGPQLLRLLEALPEQSVGIDLHPSGLIHHGHSPAETVAAVGQFILHVHACDAVRDLGERQAIDVELGRGSADLPALLGQLSEYNYAGWVTVERRDAADPVAEIGNAVAYLRSL